MDDSTEGVAIWKWESLSWSGDCGPSCASCSCPLRQYSKGQSCALGPFPAQKESSTPSIASSLWSPLVLVQFLPFFPILVLVSALVPEGPFCIPPAALPAQPLWMTMLGHSRTLLFHPNSFGWLSHLQLARPSHEPGGAQGPLVWPCPRWTSFFLDTFWGSVPHPQLSWIAGKGKWESMCLDGNNLGGFVGGRDLWRLGLDYHGEDMSYCCVSWGLVPASQQQNPAAAHSWLVYFSSLSIRTKCLNPFSILVPWDVRDIHPHMHCQMCHMSSKMLLRPHEILLLSNNGLRASLRPHYTPQIISKWQRQMILARKTMTVLPVLQQMPQWISSQAVEAQAISQNLCNLRVWLNRMAEVIVLDVSQKRTWGHAIGRRIRL